MEPTLTPTREVAFEPPTQTNNEHAQADFRDFEIPDRRPPWRMRLTPPIEYDGKRYDVLVFDFDSMTTKDFIRAHREFTHRYKPERNEIPFPDVNPLYHAIIAAHRAEVPLGLIERLPAAYWSQLRSQVLKACGGSPEEEKE